MDLVNTWTQRSSQFKSVVQNIQVGCSVFVSSTCFCLFTSLFSPARLTRLVNCSVGAPSLNSLPNLSSQFIRSNLCFCVVTFRNRMCVGTWRCSTTCWSRSKGFLATSCCSETTWRSCLTTLWTEKTQRVRHLKTIFTAAHSLLSQRNLLVPVFCLPVSLFHLNPLISFYKPVF